MGYAAFRDACDSTFEPWCQRLRTELAEDSAQTRLRDAQHVLCDLVEALDPAHLRYAVDRLKKA
jgi:hypothetical protein